MYIPDPVLIPLGLGFLSTPVLLPLGMALFKSLGKRKLALVVFDDYLSKIYIPNINSETDIDITNGAVTACMNDNPQLHIDANYLISISQAH